MTNMRLEEKVMEISSDVVDGVTVVKLEGSLDTQSSPDAQIALGELVDGGARGIVCNFADVEFVSSAGLRVLLATAKKLGALQGEIRVCEMNPVVKDVFEISGFSMIIKVFDTEPEAMQGFGA